MAHQSREIDDARLRILREQHFPSFRPADIEMLAARLARPRLGDAADVIFISLSQARRRWDRVRELLLVRLSLPEHDDLFVGMWLAFHANCCAAPVFEMLRNDSRFAS